MYDRPTDHNFSDKQANAAKAETTTQPNPNLT